MASYAIVPLLMADRLVALVTLVALAVDENSARMSVGRLSEFGYALRTSNSFGSFGYGVFGQLPTMLVVSIFQISIR